MRDRIMVYLMNRRLWRGTKVKIAYGCARHGCDNKINGLRFLLVGCECRVHAWIRRWGG